MISSFINGNLSTSAAIIMFLSFTLAFVLSLSTHEFAHALAAVKQGDETPRAYGRLTLNPVAHLDFWGAISFFIFGFGWAKPVPVNPLKFKHYRRGVAIVSLAGVLSNLIMCFVSAFFFILITKFFPVQNYFVQFFSQFFSWGMSINAMLIFLNILPIYPLDGFNYVSTFCKPNNKFIDFNYKYGYLILLFLMIVGVVSLYIEFFSTGLVSLFLQLFGWMFGL